MPATYPKRLIEVDLPIRRISAHARREKSIRHGHISTLHIWWARRPLAACRAVICASLWPDPADPLCPAAFIDVAKKEMREWTTHERQSLLSEESRQRFAPARTKKKAFDDLIELRAALLDFIADFANWDSSTVREFLDTSRALTQSAHEALGGGMDVGALPVVLDPFAGGGSIPLELLRVGADGIASDINPIPVLLNRLILEHGSDRIAEVRKVFADASKEVERRAREMLAPAFMTTIGASPIAYLWARTVQCEGPSCGVEVPMLRTLRLSQKGKESAWLELKLAKVAGVPSFAINVIQQDASTGVGTVKAGSVVCPNCGYTIRGDAARAQLARRKGGSNDARLLAVLERKASGEKCFRAADDNDLAAVEHANRLLQKLELNSNDSLSVIPNEIIPKERPSPNARGLSAVTRTGMATFGDLYNRRQLLVLVVLAKCVREISEDLRSSSNSSLAEVVNVLLATAVSKRADFGSSLCSWRLGASCVRGTFARQALSNTWDFGEMYPFAGSAGDWGEACIYIDEFLGHLVKSDISTGTVIMGSATKHVLPDDSIDALITDPPYYDSVPYADLSDFFYVWLRRSLSGANALIDSSSPKDEEIIWNPSRNVGDRSKDKQFYEEQMTLAFREARRVTKPGGIGVVVFAHKSTAGWEAILEALISAGWIATGSWPLDTERAGRTNSVGTASLASSVHIVCRPREDEHGKVRTDEIGDWRDVLQELPRRIHEWMPRLAEEGVVGADAIFACLGPALEIYSRYSRVEKASGDAVTLKEYLEHVWAAVSKEALSVIFEGADTEGFEPDARLTAMWLWTLGGAAKDAGAGDDADDSEEDDGSTKTGKKKGGFSLEYDAARKIAQGLGAHLEDLRNMVEVSGETARLLPVAERTAYLFGKEQAEEPLAAKRKKKQDVQPDLFAELAQEGVSEKVWIEKTVSKIGETTLDRIHQSMILFAASRSEALKRFLVEDGAGRDHRFWRLAQALSALYPPKCEEKRWVDGVLARKKGLGL